MKIGFRKTAKDWRDVKDDNEIARQISLLQFKLADLGNRGGVGDRALYVAGPQGVGKTHSIVLQEKLWRSRGLHPSRFRPSNVNNLLQHYQKANGSGPLVMEEADILFRSKPMFEILKQATDKNTPDTFMMVEKVEGELVETAINLNVPIVVSTNMGLTNDACWDKKLLPDRDALFDRFMPIVIPNDPLALWEWSVYLALTSYLTQKCVIRNPSGGNPLAYSNPLSVQATAIDWFTENLSKLKSISPRSLRTAAGVMGRLHFGDMPKQIAEQQLHSLLGSRKNVERPARANWSVLLQSMKES